MHDDDQGIHCIKMPLLSGPGKVITPGLLRRKMKRHKTPYSCCRCPTGRTANRGKVCDACLRAQAQ